MVFLIIGCAASVACDGQGGRDSRDGSGGPPVTGPGPRGEVQVSANVSIAAPRRVLVGELLRVEIHAPVATKTGYVYWQTPVGSRWRTIGVTKGRPGYSEAQPEFFGYPTPPSFPGDSPAVVPETHSDPTFLITRAPASPGQYRIVKSLLPPEGELVWTAAELTVAR